MTLSLEQSNMPTISYIAHAWSTSLASSKITRSEWADLIGALYLIDSAAFNDIHVMDGYIEHDKSMAYDMHESDELDVMTLLVTPQKMT